MTWHLELKISANFTDFQFFYHFASIFYKDKLPNFSGCNSPLIGNGFCNDETNNEEGNYDGGDCCGTNVNRDFCSDCKCYKVSCAAGIVPHPMVGDGFCNDEANHFECNYDGGDCCGSCVVKLYCLDCECLGGDAGNGVTSPSIGDGICHEENKIADCNYDGLDCCSFSTDLIGDGFCNDETNIPDCNYDGGDCCGSCVVKLFCSDCECFAGDETGNGASSPSIRDGFCHDDNNIEACDFDGGDCCGSCVVKQHCSDCECLGTYIPPGNVLMANGFCNDAVNNPECNYDGGDCCLLNPSTDQCSQCVCSINGAITSPNYPEKYSSNTDVSWLIEVPTGQSIEIIFIYFFVFGG